MKRQTLLVLGLTGALLILELGCRRNISSPVSEDALPAPPWFADVTEAVGLDFVHDAGPVGDFFMPQQIGSGAALFDFDGDGRLDIYLLQNGGPKGAANRLYRQEADGRFRDVSAGSGLDIAGHNMGVAVGDVNNDGRPDVLFTQYGGIRLFRNDGAGKFQDVTGEAGLSNPAWGASAAFVDYDRDGWLDLVVANYVDYDPTWPCFAPDGQRDYCNPGTFRGRASKLFHNLGSGSGVRFQDVTAESGLGRLVGPGLGVVGADFDGDGWPDLFIANDKQPNRLWINRHDGTFQEESVVRGVAYDGMGQAQAGMGVALGDLDGDGLEDLFVTHLTEETNTLWRQGPRGFFRDETVRAGLTVLHWRGTGFGTVLGDIDQDGALDVAVVNGRVSRGPLLADPNLGPHWGRYAERNQLFTSDGNGRFRDISLENAPFCAAANVARGLACGDIDGDGALDLLVTTISGKARLYRNVTPRRGHWLFVRAWDPLLKRDAYGAEVRVTAGGRTSLRRINPAGSFLCSSEARAHFGLGAASRVDRIRIVWPDSTEEAFPGCRADRSLQLCKGEGTTP
ncbi:MAG TPA: CRTAC1 family protein [Gemmataceae bacterium]|nr:CRTAC1 family protein [Gemmataceae bacterium]